MRSPSVWYVLTLSGTRLQVLFLSMLNRSNDDEMARITERGSQHAAAAWLRVANHAVLAEDQLHARQQVWQYYHTIKLHACPTGIKMPHSFTNNSTVSDIYIVMYLVNSLPST